MIVYFVVVPWVGGAVAVLLLDRAPRFGRQLLLGTMALLLAVPATLGSGVHRMWAMRMFSPFHVPMGLVRAAAYRHDHGTPEDIFQDSAFAVEKLMDMNDAAKIAVTVRKLGLRWFLLSPGDRVNWPTEIVAKPAFALDGYQLYQL